MGRRRLVVLLSALLMIALGAGAVGLFVAGTQGERGRDWIRQVVQAQLARTVRGKVHLGTISGSLLTDFRVDSIEIRGPDDSLFLATGPIRLEFDPRDILDGRFFIRAVAVERPQVWMRRTKEGKWAHDAIFARAEGVTSGGNRAIGSVIVLEQVSLSD
jgi:autotransporter translocation and assembly factor TamB